MLDLSAAEDGLKEKQSNQYESTTQIQSNIKHGHAKIENEQNKIIHYKTRVTEHAQSWLCYSHT